MSPGTTEPAPNPSDASKQPAPPTPKTPSQRSVSEQEKAENSAIAEAKRTGKPVPVPYATTETDTVVAHPNGTLGLTRSVAPVRTKQGGTWHDLDATLTASSDGQLHPKATTSRLTLSGGGNAPLATLDQDGKKLELTWPEALPKPVLDGASATYPEVSPGTDLKVTAEASGGISQILVVKSAEAARHPKLAKLTMGLKADGVSVSADASGNLKAADASGRTVFQAPVPTMWDSGAAAAVPAQKPAGTPKFSQLARSAAPQQAAAEADAKVKPTSDSEGPGAHAKVSKLRTELGKGSVALTPDQSFLKDASTAYPVFIDPAWTPTNRGTQHWAWVQEAYPDTVNYDDYADTYDPGVGYQRWASRTGLERYYIQLDTGDLGDKVIKKASFMATQSYAADNTCSNSYNVALHSTEPLLSNISWSRQPRDWEVLRTTSMNSAGGAGCSGSNTRGEWDVRDHLAGNAWRGSVTYALFASNESKTTSNNGFKRFTRDKSKLPFFYIEYNRPPYNPWSLGQFPAPQNANGNGCGWVGATAYAGMSLGAWIGDPDNNTNDAIFHVVDVAGDVVAYNSGWIGAAAGTHWVSTVPNNLSDGHTYFWRVQGGDGDVASAWVNGCMFSMDTQPPSVPVVTSAEFPPSGTLPGSTKAINQPGDFTLRSTDPISGVISYEWAFNSAIPVGGANTVNAAADGSASIKLTPTTWGTNTLRVQAVDRAGNRSQQQTYTFYVPDNPNAKTTLGDITGDERVDFIAPNPNGDLLVYPTAVDPAAGGVIASNKANSPGGLGWGDGTLTTHRGGNGIRIDDLWTWRDGQLKLYRNSLTQGGLAANGGLYYNAAKALPVTRPPRPTCTVAATGDMCGSEYAANWSRVKQILAVGDVRPDDGVTPFNDVLTVEDDGTGGRRLLLFQGTGATGTLAEPIVLVLSNAGWENLTLMAPGDATGDGLPDLWARDNTTGAVYQYANEAGNPAALGDHAKRTQIGGGVNSAGYPVMGSSGDTSGDGIPDLWALTANQRLVTWNGIATSSKVTSFGDSQTMGDARISTAHFKLDEGAGTTTADTRGGSPLTLSASAAQWADDTVASTASKVLELNSTNGVPTTGAGTGNTTTGAATAAATVVDTSRSFTVSTWAKADSLGGVVLSQAGTRSSGFILWPDGDGTWHFGMGKKDDDSWSYDQTTTMNESAKVKLGTWTQLTAAYDATTGFMGLYVNGTLAGTGYHAMTDAWKATGPFNVGLYRYQGTSFSHFAGRVSNIAVYPYSTVPTSTGTKLVSAVSSAKCADGNPGANRLQIWDCNEISGGVAQKFEVTATGELRLGGKCADISGGGTTNGAVVILWNCTTGAWNQQWLPTATSGFLNPTTGRCLDLPAGRIDNGTQLQLWDCNGSNPQRWLAAGLV
ncbi:ricin-type beta-trefoil lectin domain protein [Streptomyces sp. G1]|uniref:ricin-type beta-trefoil lectin domain protein n=1 Tax=Streptomyces sp. G1 TaxID=361572 RepID=UPI00202FE33C|nr:ricin-type beta-trefoil lectin domain protein [Streptomyces sp. G1]MCM1968086.1 ricin-type beta-trefoil lectin domain protein [Streptomyces sp. G1]